MKTLVMMPSEYPVLLAWRIAVMGVFVLAPSEFWGAVADFFNVPEPIKVFINPLLGSGCASAVEYVIMVRKGVALPKNAIYWPLKILVGWLSGSLGGLASTSTTAFWAGVGGFSAIALYLSNQKEPKDPENDQQP